MKRKNVRRKESILALSAHSDDFVLGAGGTLARYARERKKVYCIVFSYGERSHPWLKQKVIKKVRSSEAFSASRVLGCTTSFFDLKEGRFYDDYKAQGKGDELLRFILKKRISKIFTHSGEDPHPDHRAVHRITLEIADKIPAGFRPEIYTYSIWNPVSFRTSYPALYVDISHTFAAKMKAIQKYPSQRVHIALFTYLLVPYRAIRDGLRMGTRFAEHFFRVR